MTESHFEQIKKHLELDFEVLKDSVQRNYITANEYNELIQLLKNFTDKEAEYPQLTISGCHVCNDTPCSCIATILEGEN